MALRRDRHLELRADSVRGRDQDGILVSGCARVEKAAESAECGIGAGTGRRPRQGLDPVDQTVAGIDVDPRVAVGQAGFGGFASYGFLAG